MKFFVDTADVNEIRELNEIGLLDGVTTNPSLIMKSGRDFTEVTKEICGIVDGPVSGGVTTLHALWMGLPVLTMTPETPIAMQTYSGNTLRLVGLHDCVTGSNQEVVARATEWIRNPALIDELRQRTRPNLVASPFMNHEARVRELETCFREMWRRFLRNEPVTHLSVR